MSLGTLTEAAYWDRYWEEVSLPAEVRRETASPYVAEILRVFDRHLHRDPSRSVLEVGGAPGQYLAYVHRRFGYRCSMLDYSPVGCRKTRENFELLAIPVEVHEADLFSDEVDLPGFDLVFSLGLIEHFEDLPRVVERHARLVKPGGTLILGSPSFRGVTRLFMRRLSPRALALHNLSTMDLRNWSRFERELGLSCLFRGYVGGFEPSLLLPREPVRGALDDALAKIARFLCVLLGRRPRRLRRLNASWLSGYAIGVYRVPPARESPY